MKNYLFILGLFLLIACEKEKLDLKDPVVIEPPVDNGWYTVEQDSKGSIWFASEFGYTRYSNGKWEKFELSGVNIPVEDIRGFQSFGNFFYVLSNKGYLRFDISIDYNSPSPLISKSNVNLYSNTILSVLLKNNREFVAVPNGFSLFQNNNWFHKHDTLISGFAVSNDTCYVATLGYGVSRYIAGIDGLTSASSYSYGYGCLINDTVYAVHISANGNQWFGTSEGVFNHPDPDYRSQWIQYTQNEGLPDNRVILLTEDSKGIIWAGTQTGVAWFNGSSWTSYASDKVKFIKEDRSGNIWVVTETELLQYSGTWKLFTIADGLPDNVVRNISVANDSSVWLATKKGAAQYKAGIFTTFHSEVFQ